MKQVLIKIAGLYLAGGTISDFNELLRLNILQSFLAGLREKEIK